jgi:pimeloyl-ACP methyl ester carboxylesterase
VTSVSLHEWSHRAACSISGRVWRRAMVGNHGELTIQLRDSCRQATGDAGRTIDQGGPVSKAAPSTFVILTLVIGAALGLSGCSSATPPSNSSQSTSATRTPATEFAKVFRVDGHGVYVRCIGCGASTVVLISGAVVSAEGWDYLGDTADTANPPKTSPNAVEPQLAKVTRVCSYDRPGTTGFDDSPSRSSPVPQPTTAQGDARYLHDAHSVAGVSPPYVLVAHSWGGFIATTYDRLYRSQLRAMVLIDPGSQYLQTVLSPDVWNTWIRTIAANGSTNPNGEQVDYPASISFIRSLPPKHSITFYNQLDKAVLLRPPEPELTFQPQWAQSLLARSLGGTQITKTKSGRFMQSENPALVIAQTEAMLAAVRARNQPQG